MYYSRVLNINKNKYKLLKKEKSGKIVEIWCGFLLVCIDEVIMLKVLWCL